MKANKIFFKVIPFVILIVLLKLGAHAWGYEVITLNTIFSGIIGANVFLLGFLLSGVLNDYKESEKLPGDLACTLYTISDELISASRGKKDNQLDVCLISVREMAETIRNWLYKKIKTRELISRLADLYSAMRLLDGVILPNYLVRLKQEHNNLRKMVVRIHTIRETSFVSSGYYIATTTTILLLLGLILVKIEPFYESLFFVGLISYLMIFLILLIKDLDNPFAYYAASSSEDVSIKPIEDLISDLSALIPDNKTI